MITVVRAPLPATVIVVLTLLNVRFCRGQNVSRLGILETGIEPMFCAAQKVLPILH